MVILAHEKRKQMEFKENTFSHNLTIKREQCRNVATKKISEHYLLRFDIIDQDMNVIENKVYGDESIFAVLTWAEWALKHSFVEVATEWKESLE